MRRYTLGCLICAASLRSVLACGPAAAECCSVGTQASSNCVTLRDGMATATSCTASIAINGPVRIGNNTTIVQRGSSDGTHVIVVGNDTANTKKRIATYP